MHLTELVMTDEHAFVPVAVVSAKTMVQILCDAGEMSPRKWFCYNGTIFSGDVPGRVDFATNFMCFCYISIKLLVQGLW
jgi:hypothetical protein